MRKINSTNTECCVQVRCVSSPPIAKREVRTRNLIRTSGAIWQAASVSKRPMFSGRLEDYRTLCPHRTNTGSSVMCVIL